MRDYLNIGCSPVDEPYAFVGMENFAKFSRAECRAFANQLKRTFPEGEFELKSFPHDFGTYYEVVAWFDLTAKDDASIASSKAAWDAEANTPQEWDEEAKRELSESYLGYEVVDGKLIPPYKEA